MSTVNEGDKILNVAIEEYPKSTEIYIYTYWPKRNIKCSAKYIEEQSNIIAARVATGKVKIISAIYNMETGIVDLIWNVQTCLFHTMQQKPNRSKIQYVI